MTGWRLSDGVPDPAAVTGPDFLTAFRDFAVGRGLPARTTPWSLVGTWESFVDQVVEGYDWYIEEYENEIGVRRLLEDVLHDAALGAFEQVTTTMTERVAAADEQFRAALLPGVAVGSPDEPWWLRGVPARAGERFATDLKTMYGIEVVVVG
ncbi:MAG TPA: hypothetical protein VNA20_01500 [Frankiaceae bacterium]|nr:hypothetical protein [Frankiaceae bacterium]